MAMLYQKTAKIPCRICSSFTFFRNIHSRILSDVQIAKVQSSIDPRIFSIADFQQLTKLTDGSLVQSLLYEETPVRMANIIRSLPKIFTSEVRRERSFQFIEDFFHMNYKDIEDMKYKESQGSTMLTAVKHIETRLGGTTEMLSDAIFNSEIIKTKEDIDNIQEDIINLFKQNLSTEVLVSLVASCLSGKPYLVENLVIQESLDSAYENARYLCEQYYISSPELILSGDTDCRFTYFPSHLYLIFFELMKNSLRASVEHHGVESETVPPVTIKISNIGDRIIVKLSDAGGGYHKGEIQSLFKFFNTSASINRMSLYQGAHSSPLAGYGFGLGMVKIYLEHFGGRISLVNTDIGMDAVLEFQADPSKGL